MAKRGRPSKFTPELADEICERIANGEPLAKICRDEHMPHVSTVWDWEQVDPDFSQRVACARVSGHEQIAVDALDIADDSTGDMTVDKDGKERINGEVVSRSKLRVETRLKLLACWDPKRYGTQRVESEVTMRTPDAKQVMTELGSVLAKLNSGAM